MSAPAELVGYLSYLAKNYLIQTWLLLLLIGWFFLKSLPARLRAIRSSVWSMAEGRIETVAVDAIHAQKEIATANLGYSYYAEGELYSGYYSRQFHDEQQAWEYADNLKGRTVVVRYKPGHHEISALRIDDQPSDCKPDLESDRFIVHFYQSLTR